MEAQRNAAGKTFRAFARDASAPASLRSSPGIHVRSFAAVRLTLLRAESRWFAIELRVPCFAQAQGVHSMYARATHLSHPWQTPLIACDEPCFVRPENIHQSA
jgi:hypothetical protein